MTDKERIEKEAEEKREIMFSQLHEQWIQHPMTTMFKQRMEEHISVLLDKVCLEAPKSDVSDHAIRMQVYNIKGMRTVLEMMKDWKNMDLKQK